MATNKELDENFIAQQKERSCAARRKTSACGARGRGTSPSTTPGT